MLPAAVPVAEHLPTVNVSTGGQSYQAYSTFSGSGTRYLWRWGAGPGSSDNGLLRTSLKEAEFDCALLGGHLPSLHSLSQAEHLLGVHNSLWPRNSGWYSQTDLWLGFFAHRDSCTFSDEVQAWQQNGPGWYQSNMSVPLEEVARRSPRAWSDWSAPDYPGMLSWDPRCDGRALNVARDTNPARAITTHGDYRRNDKQYVCACECAWQRRRQRKSAAVAEQLNLHICNQLAACKRHT